MVYRRSSVTPEPTSTLFPATQFDHARPMSVDSSDYHVDPRQEEDAEEEFKNLDLATYMEA